MYGQLEGMPADCVVNVAVALALAVLPLASLAVSVMGKPVALVPVTVHVDAVSDAQPVQAVAVGVKLQLAVNDRVWLTMPEKAEPAMVQVAAANLTLDVAFALLVPSVALRVIGTVVADPLVTVQVFPVAAVQPPQV